MDATPPAGLAVVAVMPVVAEALFSVSAAAEDVSIAPCPSLIPCQ